MANNHKPDDENTKHLVASILTLAVFVTDAASGQSALAGLNTKDARENAIITYRNILQELDEEAD